MNIAVFTAFIFDVFSGSCSRLLTYYLAKNRWKNKKNSRETLLLFKHGC